MFMVVMSCSEDLFVEADDYEVDEDGDLVFLDVDEDEDSDSEDGFVEVGRVQANRWEAVVPADLDDEDEVEAE